MAIVVLGEALIDLVETGDDEPRLARPGGSPYNVAVGLARLGRTVRFAGRLSGDPLGTVLRNHALRSGVDLGSCVETADPSTVALVELAADGSASYRFGVRGTADFGWTDAELAALTGTRILHYGSLTSWTPPGDAAVARAVETLHRDGTLISYDPNVRPQLQPDVAAARAAVERAVGCAHLVKTSEEDLAYLYPGEAVADVAAAWLAAGPGAVVVTRGGSGSLAATHRGRVECPAHAVQVVDTVGAGDAFTSGLLDALATRGLLTPDRVGELDRDVLDAAGLVAAVTCSRAGANPPRRHELPGR